MKVLYFHQHFATPRGSTGTRSYEFARALLKRGHQVTMVCGAYATGGVELPYDPRRKWSRGIVDDIDVIAFRLPYSNHDGLVRRAWLFFRYAWRSTWLALTADFDVLFATSTPLTAGIPGVVMKLCGRRKRFIFEVRDLWPELPRALGVKNPLLLGGMTVLEWLCYRCSDACVALSPGIAEGIRRRARRDLRVEMIPNGCDLRMFQPGFRDQLTLPGLAPGMFVAAFVGAHGIANGLDAVLDAAGELLRQGRHDIRLVFIGDGREKPRLVERSQREGLRNCLFIASIPKEELAAITGRLDCGLMILANVPAFYYGTSPNKFFDYISAGLPVITNYPGWLADLITSHECGLAVPPGSATELAGALCRLAGDPIRRRTMGECARRLAEREFDRERLAARFESLLREVAIEDTHQ